MLFLLYKTCELSYLYFSWLLALPLSIFITAINTIHVRRLHALKLPETQTDYFAFCCIAFPDRDDNYGPGLKKPEIKLEKCKTLEKPSATA